jgi:mitogen-activated protein kinase kinase kinase 3
LTKPQKRCPISQEFATSIIECTPGALSAKSNRSATTASTADLPGGISPQDTPADSSVANTPADVFVAGLMRITKTSKGSGSTPSVGASHSVVNWRKGQKIGSGSHGCVYKAQNLANGHLFVVKETTVGNSTYLDRLRRELDISKDLCHPNIVRTLGHDYVEQHLYIHLEYIPGGSLRCILTEFGPLEQDLMPIAMRNLIEGLHYLHSLSPPVVHRDIKSSNVLVGQDFCLKLADFGCSKCDDTTESFTTVGSVLWMAPEVIRGKQGGHGRKADIWSLGCVFIEMATAERPWGENAFDNQMQALMHIDRSEASPPIPMALPASASDLIGQCVQRDPSCRPKAAALLKHEFVRTLCRIAQ